MSYLLCIDTAVDTASVCVALGNTVLAQKQNRESREGAAWLHTAIDELLQENGLMLPQLQAIAVSAGPGSYTGLRVGMAAAKGLCFALQRPLILIDTLQMMAVAAGVQEDTLLCPMIDARRMEVFTALYRTDLSVYMPSRNLILDESSFAEELSLNRINFFGNGSTKFQPLCNHPNARFSEVEAFASHMAGLAAQAFERNDFADLAYSEPNYGKDFHSVKQ